MENDDIFGEYLPERAEYKQYDGQDAAEIIIPSEINLSFKKKESRKKKGFSPGLLIGAFLDFSEDLGEFYVSVIKKAFAVSIPIVLLTVKGAAKAFGLIYVFLSKFKDAGMRKRISGKGKLGQDLRHIRLMTLKQDDENKTAYYLRSIREYIISLLPEQKKLLKSAVSYAFPLAVLCVIAITVVSAENKVVALKIVYKDKVVGYAENHGVFGESKEILASMLSDEESCRDLLGDVSFSLERVYPAELSGCDMISEAILANSASAYKRACGIYIDGSLLCAIQNESDALSVFSSVLSPYEEKADSDTTVGFVEEIEYIQGYYPEDSDIIWDSAKLKECITSDTSPVRVKVMKTHTRTETLKYETVKKNTSTLYKGTKKTTQKGKNGKVEVTELITYIDSKKAYTGVVSEVVTKEPVNEIVLIGTKSNSSAGVYTPSRGFIWPTRGAYSVSSHYGYRSASISGRSYHGGIDIVLGYGSSAGIPVVASASGTVVVAYSGWSGYGHTVVINHGNGITTRYAHMYPGSLTVRVGDRVYQGQQIGRIGSTGNSTGPHLHFEVLVNGYKVNPYPYIR